MNIGLTGAFEHSNNRNSNLCHFNIMFKVFKVVYVTVTFWALSKLSIIIYHI